MTESLEDVVLTYPLNYHDSFGTGVWTKGGTQKEFVFEDYPVNVNSVDVSEMVNTNGSSVSYNNTTKLSGGGFTVRVYDEGSNIIVQETFDLSSQQTRYMNAFSSLTVPENSVISKIAFRATFSHKHVAFRHDTASEFTLVQGRSSHLNFTPHASAVTWTSNKSGTNFRIVRRVSNAYRKIADSSDIVVATNLNVSGEGGIITGLSAGTTYTFALQKLENNWFDVSQETFTTNTFNDMTVNEIGSGFVSFSWEQDYVGAVYTLTATSSSGSTISVETTELSATLSGLSPGISYTFSLNV